MVELCQRLTSEEGDDEGEGKCDDEGEGDQIWEKQMSDELSARARGVADSRTLLSVLTLGLPLSQGWKKT